MNERLNFINLKVPLQTAGTALTNIKLPFRVTVVYASVGLTKVSGAPTAVQATVKDAGAALAMLNALALGNTAGVVTEVKTKHVGGTNDAVDIPKGDTLSVDLSFTGGASPTAEVDVTLGVLVGEA